MKLSLYLFVFFILISWTSVLIAQQKTEKPSISSSLHIISGKVTDTAGVPLAGTSISLVSALDTMAVSADGNGQFLFRNVKSSQFQLTLTIIGFQGIKRKYTITGTGFSKLDPIKLSISSTLLQGVNVTAINAITIKEDTVEYKASAYKVREGSPVEEIIRKLPGVSVDKDGNITAHGKLVTKVRINGKDFFSGDVQTATKNLPADIVDKLQVIDDYGDQANITGIKSGDPDKVLNIEIRKDRNKGYMLQGLAGIGNDGRYEGNLTYFQFRDKQQISVLGTLNNINQNSFRFGSNGQSANGITTTQSLGTNYRDDWGKKITVYGNYSFSNQQTYALSQILRQTVFQQSTQLNSSNGINNSTAVNHRFSFNMEYKPDTLNYLKITPSFSYGVNSSQSNGTNLLTQTDTTRQTIGSADSHTNSSNPNENLNVLYNHRFHKKGRNLNVYATISTSSNLQFKHIDNINTLDSSGIKHSSRQFQQVNNNNKSTGENVHVSYTEPLAKKNYMELNYSFSNSANQNTQNTYDIDPATFIQQFVDSLSNSYKYNFSTNGAGLNYRYIGKKANFYVGFVAQNSVLEGISLTQNFTTRRSQNNFFPAARFYYEFVKGKSFTARFRGSSNQPSFTQLQPVTDRSNPLQPVRGNPNLLAEVSNSLSLRYNQFQFKSGNVLFANLDLTQTQHKIVNNTLKHRDTLYTTYKNANGYFALNGFLNFSKPFHNRRYTVSVVGNAGYTNNISYINDIQNSGKNWILSPTAKFRLDLDTIMDSEVSAGYSINSTRYSIPSPFNTDAKTWVLALNGRNYFFKDWILGYDLSKTINKGYSSTLNANPTILNLYVERQFLKKNMAALRIEGFDLFNQNTGINRSVNANSITDSRNTRLARYVLLTFSLKLQKFAGKMPSQEDHGNRRFNGMGHGGGGRSNFND